MKTFTNMAAQGDFIIRRIDKLPEGLVEVKAVNGQHVLAHSETGHNHVMEATRSKLFSLKDATKDGKLQSLFLTVEAPSTIEHLRSHDTHESLAVPAGTYEIRPQQEYTPKGFRKAAD